MARKRNKPKQNKEKKTMTSVDQETNLQSEADSVDLQEGTSEQTTQLESTVGETPTEGLAPPFIPDDAVVDGSEDDLQTTEDQEEQLEESTEDQQPDESANGEKEALPVLDADNYSPLVKRVLAYAGSMGPRNQVTEDQIKMHQASLYNALSAILGQPSDEEAIKDIKDVLDIYLANKDQCFSNLYIGRLISTTSALNAAQRKALAMLTTFFRDISDPKSRHAKAKEVDLGALMAVLDQKYADLAIGRIRKVCNL